MTVSKPIPSSDTSAVVSEDSVGVFRIDGLTLSVKPQNADVALLTAGLIVPVIPLGSGNKVRADKHFQLILQFENSSGSYSLFPAAVVVRKESLSSAPVSVRGPLTRIGFPRELQKTSFGHPWVCSEQGGAMPIQEFTELKLPEKSCVVLEFSMPTPSPQSEFSVVVGGLKKEGIPLPIIDIHFESTKRVSGGWLGGQ